MMLYVVHGQSLFGEVESVKNETQVRFVVMYSFLFVFFRMQHPPLNSCCFGCSISKRISPLHQSTRPHSENPRIRASDGRCDRRGDRSKTCTRRPE